MSETFTIRLHKILEHPFEGDNCAFCGIFLARRGHSYAFSEGYRFWAHNSLQLCNEMGRKYAWPQTAKCLRCKKGDNYTIFICIACFSIPTGNLALIEWP